VGNFLQRVSNRGPGEHPDSPNYFRTDWDLFADAKRVPPKGDGADFSWSNFDRDLDALKKIGVSHYRFSLEWARVEPQPAIQRGSHPPLR